MMKLKTRGLARADLTCCRRFSCQIRRATEYHNNERRPVQIFSPFVPCHASCRVRSLASFLLLPACCHLLSSPATSAAVARLAKTRPEVIQVLEVILGRIMSNQSLFFSLITLWSMVLPCLHVAKIPIGVTTNGCDEWVDTHACCTLWPFCL